MRKVILFIVVTLILFVVILIGRTLVFASKQISHDPVLHREMADGFYKNYQDALRIKTISHEDAVDFDSTAFREFVTFIEDRYPLIHTKLERRIFNEFSLLYRWKGSDSSREPYLLMGHYDVVPVVKENFSDWHELPFSGELQDGILWGRGALDDKFGVMGQLEVVEGLLKEGFTPRRSIYLAFGHDEETGGYKGAKVMAEYLDTQGISLDFILDEGGARSQGLVPGTEKPIALIGLAEKGFMTLELEVKIEGGHSSSPERETAIDVLSSAISRLKKQPMPTRITPVIRQFFEYTGPEMDFGPKLVFANVDILGPMVRKMMAGSAAGNASIRTTTVPTIFNSGVKDNLIPQMARAKVNFRMLPGDASKEVIAHVTRVVNDERIAIRPTGTLAEASQITSITTPAYLHLSRTIKEIFPEVITTPFLVIGGTDSRHYGSICDNIIRFRPYLLSPDNQKTISWVK